MRAAAQSVVVGSRHLSSSVARLATQVQPAKVKESVSKVWKSAEEAVKDVRGDSIVLSGGEWKRAAARELHHNATVV